MTNNEIISYLKENRIRHTVFTSMPDDVKEWCENNVWKITIPFRKLSIDGWNSLLKGQKNERWNVR